MSDLWLGIVIGFVLGAVATVAFFWVTAGRGRKTATLESQSVDATTSRPTFASRSEFKQLLNKSAANTATVASSASQKIVVELRQNLRVKFMYDEAKIAGAISYERERNPAGNEEELMRAAIYRWERDNQ